MRDLRAAARMLLRREDVSLIDLWISYWNHGGRCHPFVFDALIYDVLIVDGFDMAALASALDELSLEPAG
jgi:hypothetical protein